MPHAAQSSLKCCLTCDRWGGARTADPTRTWAKTNSVAEKGECLGGGINHIQVPAVGSCGKWGKWGPLK
jgi:hypothetical protein